MHIPIELETSTDFTTRIASLLTRDDTHIYIDTSFLMWLTKIGKTSRGELFQWFAKACVGRVHVPVWAAHEYLGHHIAGTIVDEVDHLAGELAITAARTYANLRPFLDDSLESGTASSEAQQVTARDTLNALQHLAQVTKRWKQGYVDHANEVIEFINNHVTTSTPVFGYMSTIETISASRFSGRIPPGFQDRGKKAQSSGIQNDKRVRQGSNWWGDLVFWQELLEHSAVSKAKALIILTKDRKNDWQLGGRGVEGVEPDLFQLKSKWTPVPCAHPMLSLEAQVTAGIDQVALLDPPYLAVLLRNVVGDGVKKFVDVAIVPDPPPLDRETARRRSLIEDHRKTTEMEATQAAAKAELRFVDGSQLRSSPSAFLRALRESRQPPAPEGPLGELLGEITSSIESGTRITELFEKQRLEPFNNSMLTALARELHDRALNQAPGYKEALSDLISILHELPELTAGSLFLGMIASMYLDRGNNQSRLPPRSPVSKLLFDRQDANYSAFAIEALQTRMSKNPQSPLYRMHVDCPTITAQLDIVPDTDGEVIVGSLRISGQEVFTPAQGDHSLRLSTLVRKLGEASGEELVMHACEIFAVPFDQVERTDDFERTFKFDETAGFKRPGSVYLDNEEAAQ